MLSTIYRLIRQLADCWLLGALLLIAATAICGTVGLREMYPDASGSAIAYQVLQLFDLGADIDLKTDAGTSGWLHAGRWLGALVWSFTILTLLVGLFRQPILRAMVQLLARNHVVILVDWLGENLVPLIQRLRTKSIAELLVR